jgi:hypothetical protein
MTLFQQPRLVVGFIAAASETRLVILSTLFEQLEAQVEYGLTSALQDHSLAFQPEC